MYFPVEQLSVNTLLQGNWAILFHNRLNRACHGFRRQLDESIFLSRVEGRGFHVEGEGTMSRVEGNIFFSIFFFFWKR